MANQPVQSGRKINAPTKLLSKSENDQLFNVLGDGCTTLATAVVQVYLAQPNPNSWTKKCCGVVCFVKDNNLRSYFIRVYNIGNGMKLWEQEIYRNMEYNVTSGKPFFHTFETDTCWAALNFANDGEAREFSSPIITKIEGKKQSKRENKKRSGPQAAKQRPSITPPVPPNLQRQSPKANIPTTPTTPTTKKKKKKKMKLSKKDISEPADFTHVSHCGYSLDENSNHDMLEENEDIITPWLKNLGLERSMLNNQKSRDFILKFVEQNGGIDAVKKEQSKGTASRPPLRPSRSSAPQPPPVDYRSPPPPPPLSPRAAPPHSPSLQHPPPPSRRPPPTPLPSRAMMPSSMTPPAMLPPSMIARARAPPPPPPISGGGGPPPPPPPPPPSGGAAPPPPPPIEGWGGSEDLPAPPSSARETLMDAIRGGTTLKKVDVSDREAEMAPAVPVAAGDQLGTALLNALQMRKNVIHHDSDNDDDSDDDDFDDDDDEWD